MYDKFLRSFLICIVLVLVGCSEDKDDFSNTIDQELISVLTEHAPDNSLEYYILPASDHLSSIPQDENNMLTESKVELGKLLFHETGIALSPKHTMGTGTYSCATCHHAKAGFQAGRVQGVGDGGKGFGLNGEDRQMMDGYGPDECDVQPIRTPSTLNVAYQQNMLWNGKLGAGSTNLGYEDKFDEDENTTGFNNLGFEGPETQAIVGLGVHRLEINEFIQSYERYVELFEDSFSEPEPVNKVNAGLAIAAYERTLLPNKAPFQMWLNGNNDAMSEEQKKGAILFFGKANCGNCHTGPALNSMTYHALGMKDLVNQGEIDTQPNHKAHLGRGGFTGNNHEMFAFKVPQLYNLKDSEFYGHGGSFRSVTDVIEYKNKAIPENHKVMQGLLSSEFVPLGLSDEEITSLVDFIENALYDDNLERFVPENLPSGNCFPNNDNLSKADLGCE